MVLPYLPSTRRAVSRPVPNLFKNRWPVTLNGPALLLTVLYIAFAFGMSLTATAWCMSRVSGSLYNPAVSYAESFPFTRLMIFDQGTPCASDIFKTTS